jgi:serine/threonine-protein kinase
VPIYEVGEHEGRPYYTMKVYDCALADQLNRYREPVVAATLVTAVARAVHHGHQRGVLHRDLKPANILLDEHGRPHVSDFGAAKRVGGPPTTGPGVLIGTLPYMAPEQALGDNQSVTTAIDVYSLGVVLYELITGTLPFDGDSATVLRAVLGNAPMPPRQRAPAVPRELQAICLKCIEKDPAARYHTAEELADDLERFLRGEPVVARRASLAKRTWRFTRRHWLVVSAGTGTLLLLAVVAATAISVARTQELELEDDVRQTNAYWANIVAKSVELQLYYLKIAVVHAAADPSIVQLVHDHSLNDQSLKQLLKELNERKERQQLPSDTIATFDLSGVMLAHAGPMSPGQLGSDYSWRDYFKGTSQLGKNHEKRTGYVSRVFLSEADGQYRFAAAAPVYDKEDKWVGVLMVTIGTDSLLGPMRLDDERSGRTGIVVGRLDRSRTNSNATDEYVTLWHGQPKHGEAKIASSGLRLETRRTEPNPLRWTASPELVTDNDYRDPVPGFEGRWLVGSARVETTDCIVIIQTRYDAAVAANARLWRRLVSRVGIAFLTWSLFSAGVWAYSRRRRRALVARYSAGAAPPVPDRHHGNEDEL